MNSTRISLGRGLFLAVAVVMMLGAVQAADDEAALRKQIETLNDVTGDDPIRGQIDQLVQAPEETKKLLRFASTLAKKDAKDTFNYTGAYVLARTAQRLKELETSRQFYQLAADQAKALRSGSKIGQAYGGLISVYYEEGKYEESEKLCREVLEMRGDETLQRVKPVVLRQMIQSLAKQGKTEEANKLVDELLRLQPDNWLTLELRGWVQREAGKYEEAARTYEDVLERITNDKELDKDEKSGFTSEIRYILSSVYVDAKKVQKAAEQLKALLKEEPDNPSYNNDLGYIWADHDMNLDEAEQLIRKAIKEDRKLQENAKITPVKDNAAYLDSLGWVLFKKKQFKEALPHLEKAVSEEEGKHIEIYDHLAEVYMALGNKDKAISTWKKGLEVVGESRREQQRKTEVEKKLKAVQ